MPLSGMANTEKWLQVRTCTKMSIGKSSKLQGQAFPSTSADLQSCEHSFVADPILLQGAAPNPRKNEGLKACIAKCSL